MLTCPATSTCLDSFLLKSSHIFCWISMIAWATLSNTRDLRKRKKRHTYRDANYRKTNQSHSFESFSKETMFLFCSLKISHQWRIYIEFFLWWIRADYHDLDTALERKSANISDALSCKRKLSLLISVNNNLYFLFLGFHALKIRYLNKNIKKWIEINDEKNKTKSNYSFLRQIMITKIASQTNISVSNTFSKALLSTIGTSRWRNDEFHSIAN